MLFFFGKIDTLLGVFILKISNLSKFLPLQIVTYMTGGVAK